MAIWEPTYQIGTPWVGNAEAHDVHVIFCICIVEIVFGILHAFSSICRMKRENPKIRSEKWSTTKIEAVANYTIHVFQIYAPIFGICAIKLDCLQFMKVRFFGNLLDKINKKQYRKR